MKLCIATVWHADAKAQEWLFVDVYGVLIVHPTPSTALL
jgi:hypothetical protein